MSPPVIDVLSPSFSSRPILTRELSEAFPNASLLLNETGRIYSEQEIARRLLKADAAIVGRETVNQKTVSPGCRLTAISVYGVGVDNIDLQYCESLGIKVLYGVGVNRLAVAEHALGLMLSVCRNIAENHCLLVSGVWRKDGGVGLFGKTVGIIGLGAIGLEVARLLKAFDCRVLYHDIVDRRDAASPLGLEGVALEELLGRSNIVSIHTPLTDLTRGLADESFFGKMMPGSFLINTARGAIVDLSELKKVVKIGKLKGAGLDVFPEEPIKDPELCCLPGVTLTPHTAGNSVEAVLAMGRQAISGLVTAAGDTARNFQPGK